MMEACSSSKGDTSEKKSNYFNERLTKSDCPAMCEELKSRLHEEAITKLQKPNIPNVNVPEKIVICLDVCNESDYTLFKLGDGTSFTPLNMLKRAIDFFLFSKMAINKRTEFALVILKDQNAHWIQDFTSNTAEFSAALDLSDPEESTAEEFDFDKVFDLVEENVQVPEYNIDKQIIPPPYVVRLLILYGRSNAIPKMPNDRPLVKTLKKHLFFYVDILLSHEEECAKHKCEQVYDALQDLDNGYSYVFEVARNPTAMHNCIAKLLAHPLQRPLQKDTNYTFG